VLDFRLWHISCNILQYPLQLLGIPNNLSSSEIYHQTLQKETGFRLQTTRGLVWLYRAHSLVVA
jgi:hypothetical protein